MSQGLALEVGETVQILEKCEGKTSIMSFLNITTAPAGIIQYTKSFILNNSKTYKETKICQKVVLKLLQVYTNLYKMAFCSSEFLLFLLSLEISHLQPQHFKAEKVTSSLELCPTFRISWCPD